MVDLRGTHISFVNRMVDGDVQPFGEIDCGGHVDDDVRLGGQRLVDAFVQSETVRRGAFLFLPDRRGGGVLEQG